MTAAVARAVVAVLAAAAVVSFPTSSVGAIDHSKGLPGYCPNGVGVTVVVDFQSLGGAPIVRCLPSRSRGTGLDALKGAGFQIEGARRWGESFICRIENRPSAVEALPIAGNPGYREQCIDTPPAAGYWSYWHAGNNCTWEYSQWGVKNRDFVQGGFEGWSFSLNATADTNPVPRVAPVRPGTGGGACNASEEPPPSSDDPGETQPPRPSNPAPPTSAPARPPLPDGGSGPVAGPSPAPGGSSDGGRGPGATDQPRADHDPSANASAGDPGRPGQAEETDDAEEGRDPDHGAGPDHEQASAGRPHDQVEFSGGEEAADVRDLLREQSGSSPAAPWAAAVVIVGLVGGGSVVAWRRRRARYT